MKSVRPFRACGLAPLRGAVIVVSMLWAAPLLADAPRSAPTAALDATAPSSTATPALRLAPDFSSYRDWVASGGDPEPQPVVRLAPTATPRAGLAPAVASTARAEEDAAPRSGLDLGVALLGGLIALALLWRGQYRPGPRLHAPPLSLAQAIASLGAPARKTPAPVLATQLAPPLPTAENDAASRADAVG